MKEEFQPVDICNRTLKIGQTVAVGMPGTMNLIVGTVIKINKKTVLVECYKPQWMTYPHGSNTIEYQRAFNNVVVLVEKGQEL